MKITKEQLRQLIQEELEQIDEETLEDGIDPVTWAREREKRLGVGPKYRAGIDEPSEDPAGGDPLRDAVKQFVDAVKDHI